MLRCKFQCILNKRANCIRKCLMFYNQAGGKIQNKFSLKRGIKLLFVYHEITEVKQIPKSIIKLML